MMRRPFITAGICLVGAGCANPLADVPKLAEVELSQTDAAAAALPTDAEIAREGLVGVVAEDVQTTAPVAAPEVGTGAGAEVETAIAPKRQGLLGLLRRGRAPQDAEAAAIAQSVAAAQEQPASEPQSDPAPIDPAPQGTEQTDGTIVVAAQEENAPAPSLLRRGGLLGLLGRVVPAADNPDEEPPADAQSDVAPAAVVMSKETGLEGTGLEDGGRDLTAGGDTQTAALPPAPAPRKRGLFGKRRAAEQADAKRTGPDARDVDFGTVLPFGVVARVCDAKGQSLGQRVEKAPARGFALHDSALGSAGARTWYITGFADGCPRQLTGANVLIGSATLYEQLHYGPGGKDLPFGETDKAYERIKRKVCGTRKGKPCGAKIGQMEKSTFFVSAYERFGNSSRWSELVIHDGSVVAATIKPN